MTVSRRTLLAVLGVAVIGAAAQGQRPGGSFDHAKHRKLFPTCTTCHLGAVQVGASLWPDPGSCATCHDGKVQKQVEWHGKLLETQDRALDRLSGASGNGERALPEQAAR